MIQEAINFVKEFEANQTESQNEQEDWKGKKFIIVNTEELSNKLKYKDFEVLKNDGEIEKFLENNKHYKEFFNKLNKNILPLGLNKALGSSQGLATSCFFAFRLSKKNMEGYKTKLDTTFKGMKKLDVDVEKSKINTLFEEILNIEKNNVLKALFEDKSDAENFKHENYYVVINVQKYLFEEWNKIINDFINQRASALRSTLKGIEGKCSICQNSTNDLSAHSFMTSLDEGKIFLRHKTKICIDDDGKSLLVCKNCRDSLNSFESIVNDKKLKIFPLFIDSTIREEEIKLIKETKSGDSNTFSFVMGQLEQRDKLKEKLDFYLIVYRKSQSGKYFFFDYINNYMWRTGKVKDFFDKTDKLSQEKNRMYLQQQLSKILSREIDYFGDRLKGKDSQSTSLVYSIRQKLFDFVYRNKNSISLQDISKIILFRIDKDIVNNSVKPFEIKEFLNFYMNNHILEGREMNETSVILNKVKDMRDNIISNNFDKFKIRDKEEWAYWAGQIAYYLVTKSKSANQNFGLLEPFTNKSTTDLVNSTLKELFEKYKHAINLIDSRFKTIFCKVLDYSMRESFLDLKIVFYIGVFDYPIMFEKSNKEAE